MNTTPIPAVNSDELNDVIGRRVLTGTQMVWISRLSTHPLPMIDSGFVTVAGQGPSDSNGAGKSSYIAAVSLLCGDEQWRWASGAKAASELLFTAEVAAQEHHSNANHGFVIGVFTDPAATTTAALQASAVTVWLKINRTAPYIDLRWAEGLHLAAGATEAERADNVEAAWSRLQRRGAKADLHANSFNAALYGGNVRSVSFLSTSVRASHTPNLLAQPLNELTPERIFDAVAALTGIDRELEHEREQRTVEHHRRERLNDVEAKLAQHEIEWARIEAAIAERERARGDLESTRAAWKGQCARAIVDSHDRVQHLHHLTQDLVRQRAETEEKLQAAKSSRETLADDDAFNKQCRVIEERWKAAQRRQSGLEIEAEQLTGAIDGLQRERRTLSEQARNADGRTVAEAAAEELAAQEQLNGAKVKAGIAKAGKLEAKQRLEAAENGNARGAAVMERLRAAGIPASPLLDLLIVDEAARTTWEPRLAPFEEAVVVADADFDQAVAALDDAAGDLLVAADAPTEPPASPAGLPEVSDARFRVGRFLTALADRADDTGRFTDAQARLKVFGHFPDPITGRTARIRKAQQELEAAASKLKKAEAATATAASGLALAKRRLTGAEAAKRAEDLAEKIEQHRTRNEEIAEIIEAERLQWTDAETVYATMTATRLQRNTEVKQIDRAIDGFRTSLLDNVEQRQQHQDEIARIDLESLLAAFDTRNPDDAAVYLASLDEHRQRWSLDEWVQETLDALEQGLVRCFPQTTAPDTVPKAITECFWSPDKPRITPRSPAAAFTVELIAGLAAYLRSHEEFDKFEKERIGRQRSEQSANLAAAQSGFTEASTAAEALRSSLAAGITATIKQVAKHFDALDRSYGGYGATLECPEPPAPSEPDQPWRWALTPKWSRAEGQRPASYRLKGNTAQVEEKAIKLVCAAALASGDDRPLVLILDELGRNLGKQHRRDAVALFEAIGKDRNITVIGALQDDMERYAIEASGLFIKLRRSSDAQPYNDPPAVVGHVNQTERVRLLQAWLETGHLAAGRPGEADRPR